MHVHLEQRHALVREHHRFTHALQLEQAVGETLTGFGRHFIEVEHAALDRRRSFHAGGERQPQGDQHAAEHEYGSIAVHVRKPAAYRAAEKDAQRLRSIIHTHRGPLGGGGSDLGDDAGQAGLEHVEGHEVGSQRGRDAPEMIDGTREQQLRPEHERNGRHEHVLELGLLLAINDRRHHADEGQHHDGQIYLPVVIGIHPAGFHECERHHHEHCHLRGVQRENPEIETQQLGVLEHFGELARGGFRIRMETADLRVGHDKAHDQYREYGEDAGQGENAGYAYPLVECRSCDERESKGDADGAAYHRHRLGAVFLARQVGNKRGDGGRYRSGALDGPTEDDGLDVGRECGDEAAQRENRQAEINHAFAAVTIGCHAEGQLEQCLRQAIGAEREADHEMAGAARQALRVDRENRQDEEHSQHAQAINGSEAEAGAQLDSGHAFRLGHWKKD